MLDSRVTVHKYYNPNSNASVSKGHGHAIIINRELKIDNPPPTSTTRAPPFFTLGWITLYQHCPIKTLGMERMSTIESEEGIFCLVVMRAESGLSLSAE